MNEVLSVHLNNHGYVDFIVTYWVEDKFSGLSEDSRYEIEFEPQEEQYMICLEDYEIEEAEVQLVKQLREM